MTTPSQRVVSPSGSTKKNAAILLISTFFGIVTQLSQFVLLGRFLSPEQIGIASIVLVIVMFAQMFTDFGLSGYYIHRQNITNSEKSTLYWLNLALGFLLAFIVSIFSPIISWFYGHEQLTYLLLMSALSFPIIAAGSQFQASLLKQFSYKETVTIEVIARIAGLLGFVVAIYFGANAACVVYGHLTLCITKTILLFYYIDNNEYPKFTFYKEYVRGGFKFGVYVLLAQFINQITMNLDKLLIGKFLGMSNLGVYTLAKDLAARSMLIVNPIVNKLCLPKYAAIQEDKKRLAVEVSNTMLILGFFSSLMFFSLSIVSEVVVFIMYGPGNIDTANILKILAFYMLFRSFSNIISTLLNSVGNTKLDFKWQCIASLVAIPSIYILVQYNMQIMAFGLVVLQAIFVTFSYFISIRLVVPLNFSIYIRRVFLFPIIGAGLLMLPNLFEHASSLIQIFLNYLQWLVLYLIISLILYKTPLKKYI